MRFEVRDSIFEMQGAKCEIRCWMLDVGCWTMFDVRYSIIENSGCDYAKCEMYNVKCEIIHDLSRCEMHARCEVRKVGLEMWNA